MAEWIGMYVLVCKIMSTSLIPERPTKLFLKTRVRYLVQTGYKLPNNPIFNTLTNIANFCSPVVFKLSTFTRCVAVF